MALKAEALGPLAYGGLVVGANQWDKKRIADGALLEADVFKKFSTWTYLVLGGGATAMSAFGMMRQFESWTEAISHGFIYGFPAFITDMIGAMTTGGTTQSKKAAIAEAQRIMRTHRQLGPGAGREASRSYQQEFEIVAPHAF